MINCEWGIPAGVAVDGGGNIYVTNPTVPAVYKAVLSNGSCTTIPIGGGWSKPNGIAVDGSGNVYVTDSGNSAVYKLALSNGIYTQTTIGYGFITPMGVAVDGSGKVYVTDYSYSEVRLETPSGDGYLPSDIGNNWITPWGIAVDGIGNVYVADYGYIWFSPFVYKETMQTDGSYTQSTIGNGWVTPYGVAVDGMGNVYVADYGIPGVYKEDLADLAPLQFASTIFNTASSDSPQTVTVTNQGNSALTFSAVSYPSDFPKASWATSDCSTSTALGNGEACTLSIEFMPTAALGSATSAALNENVTVTTNALNTSATMHTIAVTGTETLPMGKVMLATSSDPDAVGSSVTFTATVIGTGVGLTPTGTVTFSNGGTVLGAPVMLNNGVATYSTSSLPIGAYEISSSYSGDSNYLGSNSNAITESIIAAPATSAFGNTNIGTVNVGSASNTIPLTVTFSTAETLGSIAVLTQGAANQDFTNAGGGSCAIGTAYTVNATCTVNVAFTPKHPGTRYGAVVLADNTGSVLGTGYLQGTGVGPQAIFPPGTMTTLRDRKSVV